jgi:hypothetical protein
MAKIARREETANVGSNTANDYALHSASLQEIGEAGMLGCHRVGFEIFLEAFSPNGLKAISVQIDQEFCTTASCNTVRRIQVIFLSNEASMVGRMPVLAGVNADPVKFQKPIDARSDLQTARHRQLAGTKLCEAVLHIHDEQTGLAQYYWLHGFLQN